MEIESSKFSHGQDYSSAEASALGFPPGMWPRQIVISGLVFTLVEVGPNKAEYTAKVVVWND